MESVIDGKPERKCKMKEKKVDIFVDGKYVYSTIQSKTCREAMEKLVKSYPRFAGRRITACIDHNHRPLYR